MQNIPVMECTDGFYRAEAGAFKAPAAKTAAYTIDPVLDAGRVFTNVGATGSVTITLPAAKAGLFFLFAVRANFNIVVAASGGAKINNSAANGNIAPTTTPQAGVATALVFCPDGVDWHVLLNGNWTTT